MAVQDSLESSAPELYHTAIVEDFLIFLPGVWFNDNLQATILKLELMQKQYSSFTILCKAYVEISPRDQFWNKTWTTSSWDLIKNLEPMSSSFQHNFMSLILSFEVGYYLSHILDCLNFFLFFHSFILNYEDICI